MYAMTDAVEACTELRDAPTEIETGEEAMWMSRYMRNGDARRVASVVAQIYLTEFPGYLYIF